MGYGRVEKMLLRWRVLFFILIIGASLVSPASGDLFPSDSAEDEVLDGKFFYISPRRNNEQAHWIFEQSTNRPIGYAPWDQRKRRWTLFNMRGEYQGFIQALIGTDEPPHYTQYSWYDKDNRYKGVFVARLGGRPHTRDLPFGELGGELRIYERGNIPVKPPRYDVETDPIRLFPEGIETEPMDRLPGRLQY